ncbi:MAG: urease accessory protein UreE [Alphaproteobacteria bacterium]
METVSEILPAGHWPKAEERDSVTLAYEARHRRRLRMSGERGSEFLLDLPHTVLMREGDGLRLPSGGYVRVCAAAEPLLEVTAASAAALARLAWHLGNRHLPAEIGSARILIHRDHVIADMLRGLGATVRDVVVPFNPETGAYSGGHHHEHS